MACFLTACGREDSKVDQVIQSQMQETNQLANESISWEAEAFASPDIADASIGGGYAYDDFEEESESDVDMSIMTADGEVDVDLTRLSSTMVYSEVYNMMYMPDEYIGKTIRMHGVFSVYTNQDGSKYYPAIIVADATACCSQGIEFILEGNPAYPEGYPDVAQEATITGVFETYEEDGNLYCRLQNAKIEDDYLN